MGFQRPNLVSRPVRFWVTREYLNAYAPEHDPLFIVAVIHGWQADAPIEINLSAAFMTDDGTRRNRA